MRRALSEFHIAPVRTTIPLHLQIMETKTSSPVRLIRGLWKEFYLESKLGLV